MTAEKLGNRLAWIGGLSFGSGLPYFFFTETIPLWLTQEGMSLAGIGLATGASMPWVLKFLWAPLVDRYGGRRTWIRACLVLLAAVTAVFAFADPTHHGAALGGPAAPLRDALRHPGHRGRRLHHRDDVGPRAGRRQLGPHRRLPRGELRLQRAAGLCRRAPWVGRGVPGRPRGSPARSRPRRSCCRRRSRGSQHAQSLAEPIAALLRRPGIWAVILFALTFKLDISAMDPMTKPFWIASGLRLSEIAVLTTGRLIATLAGAALGGVLATRIGLFRALWTMGLVQLLSSLGYSLAAALPTDRVVISSAALFENFAAGLGTAAFLAFLMAVCERRYAATQFALLTAVYALSRWAVGLFSGVLAEQFGYASYFLFTFALGVPAYGLLPGFGMRYGRRRGGPVRSDRDR